MNNIRPHIQPVIPEVVTLNETPEIQCEFVNVGQSNFDCSNIREQLKEICVTMAATNSNELKKIATIKLVVPVMLVIGSAQISEVTLK